MTYYPLKYAVIVILAAALLLAAGGASSTLAQEASGVEITSPGPGEIVTGLVTVTGSVNFDDFLKYEVLLKMGDRLIWAATVYSPVIDGNLARLDTRTFVNGTYQLIIRKVGNDSQYTDHLGPTFTIDNPGGAPLPYPEIESSFLYPVEDKALVRVRNCTGEDFAFDYGSPIGFRDAGQITLPPKEEDYLCPYADLALKPAEYRGTAKGGAQTEAVTYSFVAEAGKIYQIIYNGPAAGANQLYIGPIEGDKRAAGDLLATGQNEAAGLMPATATPQVSTAAEVAVVAEPTVAPTVALVMPAPPIATKEPAQAQTMLPVSGQGSESRTPFIVAGVVLILLLVVGGVIAARRGRSIA